jgi:hypothetical protein
VGLYQPAAGLHECISCAAGKYAGSERSDSETDCINCEGGASKIGLKWWSTEATYLLGSTAGVPEARRAIRGPDLRWRDQSKSAQKVCGQIVKMGM